MIILFKISNETREQTGHWVQYGKKSKEALFIKNNLIPCLQHGLLQGLPQALCVASVIESAGAVSPEFKESVIKELGESFDLMSEDILADHMERARS